MDRIYRDREQPGEASVSKYTLLFFLFLNILKQIVENFHNCGKFGHTKYTLSVTAGSLFAFCCKFTAS